MFASVMARLGRRGWAKPDAGQRLELAGVIRTDRGVVREGNEDAICYLVAHHSAGAVTPDALAAVADGMGGHAAGEVASQITIDMISRFWMDGMHPPPRKLAQCIRAANEAILARSRADSSCAGMGTTCSIMLIRQQQLYMAHIGDSRIYLLRDNQLQQISEDHSPVAEMLRAGEISEAEAWDHPDRNIISRALGLAPVARPQIWQRGMQVLVNDRLVICSDGLSDLVRGAVIQDIVATLDPAGACDALVDAALRAGGTDNVSVGVFHVTMPRAGAIADTRHGAMDPEDMSCVIPQ